MNPDDELLALAQGQFDLRGLVDRPKPGQRAKPAPPPRGAAPRPAAPPPPPTRPAKAPLDPAMLELRLGEAEAALRAAGEKIAALEASLAEARAATAAATAARDAAVTERDGLDQERRGLQRRLTEAQSVEKPSSLAAMLDRRGLKGEDEAVAALLALAQAGRLGGLLGLLSAESAFEAALDRQIFLHCGEADCPAPSGGATVRVARGRCEICGGSGQKRALARLWEALLLGGVRRVVVVGGSPAYHKVLREGADPRVSLKLVPGDQPRTARQAKADLDGAELVVVWGGTMLDHSVSELYGGGTGARVVTVAHRGLSRMADKVREEL